MRSTDDEILDKIEQLDNQIKLIYKLLGEIYAIVKTDI
jgi:hypothetical protein